MKNRKIWTLGFVITVVAILTFAAVKYFPVGVFVTVEETAEQFEALSQALTQ
jgi:hypothetical protein